MPKRIGKRRFAVLKAAAGGYGLGEAVGQVGELEMWQGEDGRFGVSFFWPAPISQAFFQESQEYFHSQLVYELVEDEQTVKLCHSGHDCLVFELIEEEHK